MANEKVGEERLRHIRQSMKEKGIDVLVCMKPEHSFYLSGFNPIIYSHPVVAILPLEGPLTILVHALRDDHARSSAWAQDIRLYGAWSTKKTMGPNWLKALGSIMSDLKVADGTIGIEEDFLSITRMKQFQEAFPEARFADCSGIIRAARLIKEPIEIEYARKASRIADVGMDAAIEELRRGGNERQISGAGMAAMNKEWTENHPDVEVCDFGSLEGGVQNGLWSWCLTGDHIQYNCDNPTTRKAQNGEFALIFIWAICNGIHSENERVVAVGELSKEKHKAFETVLEVRAKVKEWIKPGTPVAQLYNVAKENYIRLGYEKYIPGRIGHGMGLGAHEDPSIEGNSTITLAPGMIITIEPNLRIPEWGGLQHSDTVLVTPDGCEYLTKTPNGFLQVPAA